MKRFAVTLAALASILGVSLVVTPAADAAVYGSCTMSRCDAARSAKTIWQSKGYPGARGWYSWPNGQCNFAGGTFYNREGQLPSGHSYREFDVYPRACGASRDAYRIIVDLSAGVVYFSPNHYADFYRL
ncbi:ribonuclease domain-containing protein [Actinophytocola sp. KF-1]